MKCDDVLSFDSSTTKCFGTYCFGRRITSVARIMVWRDQEKHNNPKFVHKIHKDNARVKCKNINTNEFRHCILFCVHCSVLQFPGRTWKLCLEQRNRFSYKVVRNIRKIWWCYFPNYYYMILSQAWLIYFYHNMGSQCKYIYCLIIIRFTKHSSVDA